MASEFKTLVSKPNLIDTDIFELMNFAADLTTKVIVEFTTTSLIHKPEVLLDIPYKNHSISRIIAAFYNKLSQLEKEKKEVVAILKEEFYKVPINRHKSLKDFKDNLEYNEKFNYITYMEKLVQANIKILDKYQDDLIELQRASNAFTNMKNTGL